MTRLGKAATGFDATTRIAFWPDSSYRDPCTGNMVVDFADAHAYMKLMLEALLPREKRLLLEATWCNAGGSVPYRECLVRLRSRHRRVEQLAGGANDEVARFNAELFAVRRAVLNAKVPVLGRLLDHGRVRADLLPYKDVPLESGWYELNLQTGPAPALVGASLPSLPKPSYRLRVTMQPASDTKRTRYLTVEQMPTDLAEVVSPYMAITGTIYLHRLILALQRRPISELERYADVRSALGVEPYEDDLLQGHHINAIGYDCRASNLQPLAEAAHAARHRRWAINYNDLSAGMLARAGSDREVRRPAARRIVAADHFELPTEGDMGRHAGNYGPLATSEAAELNNMVAGMVEVERAVSVADIEAVAGRSDAARNIASALRALVTLGGQATMSDIASSRSTQRMAVNTLRNALSSLEAARIISVGRSPEGVRDGWGPHYRIVRPLAEELQRALKNRKIGRRRPL